MQSDAIFVLTAGQKKITSLSTSRNALMHNFFIEMDCLCACSMLVLCNVE